MIVQKVYFNYYIYIYIEICPSGYSWYNYPNINNNVHYKSICSDKGICDETSGKCKCQNGFSGKACDKSILLLIKYYSGMY